MTCPSPQEEKKVEMTSLIEEALEQCREKIKAKVKEDIEKQVIEQLSWSLRQQVGEIVSDFISAEFTDEIKKMLINGKPKMLKEMEKGIVSIGAALSECLTAKALENLEIGSYRSREILKKIFE